MDIETHNLKEKYVVTTLTKIADEFKSLFFQVEEKYVVPLRMQLIGAFTIIDVLANYWFEYLGKSGTPSERLYSFIECFCFKEINETFNKSSFLKNITKEDFKNLRDSLVHFYGIGKNKKIVITANFSKTHTLEDIEVMIKELQKGITDLVVIQPQEIRNLIIDGSILMLEFMREEVRKSQTDTTVKSSHIAGIDRIYNKLINEGAEGIQ